MFSFDDVSRFSLASRLLLIANFLISYFATAQSLPADSQQLYKSLNAIYNYKFDDFETSLNKLSQQDRSVLPLLKIFEFRWKEVPVAFSSSHEKYHELLLKEANQLEKEKAGTPILSYYKICTNLFLSEYHSALQENWTALKYAQKAYPLLIEAIDKNYSEPEFQFIKGLYLYYVEYYKQKNIFYRAALVPLRSGDKKKGIELLRSAIEKPSMAQVESRIFLAHILLHLENKPFDALAISKTLHESYPANLKFTELYCDNLLRCKMYTEAIPFVEQLENQKSKYYLIPGYYFKGMIEEEFYKNSERAKRSYEQCVEEKFMTS